MQPGTYLALIARLESIASSLAQTGASADAVAEWLEAESHLKTVADGLREEYLRKQLAQTSLPSLLTTYLRLSVSLAPLASSSTSQANDSGAPSGSRDLTGAEQDLSQSIQTLAIQEAKIVNITGWTEEVQDGQTIANSAEGAVREVGRVAANLVFDDDANRAILMTYQYPASLLQVFAVYSDRMKDSGSEAISAPTIGVIRALAASLLNCVLGDYDAIKLFLLQPMVLAIMLRLSNELYQPCTAGGSGGRTDSVERAGISGWIWRILEESMAIDKAYDKFSAEAIPLVLSPLKSFVSSPMVQDQDLDVAAITSARTIDLQILTTACQTIEGLSLDRPDLLPTFTLEQNLRTIVSFVENGAPPATWFHRDTSEPSSPMSVGSDPSETNKTITPPLTSKQKAEKAIGLGKACAMKVLVEICGETGVEDKWFWATLRRWLKAGAGTGDGDAEGSESSREDLVSCASLCFGNSARSEQAACNLLAPFPSLTSTTHTTPEPLLPLLLPLVQPSTDPKIQHALIGLLKNLSIPTANKVILGEAGVIEGLVRMKVLDAERDLLGSVQGGAVGVLKHLAVGNGSNSLLIITPNALTDPSSTPFRLLALIARSDDLAIKCESTRIFVNVIKSLYSSSKSLATSTPAPQDDFNQKEAIEQNLNARVQQAKAVLEDEKIVKALYGMISLAGKYSVLVGEGVLALNLLCRSPGGLRSVAKVTLEPDSPDESKSAPLNTLLNRLHPIADNEKDVPSTPLEIKSNIYLLLITIRKTEGMHALPGFQAAQEAVERTVALGAEGKEEGMLKVLGSAWSSEV